MNNNNNYDNNIHQNHGWKTRKKDYIHFSSESVLVGPLVLRRRTLTNKKKDQISFVWLK